MLNGTNLKILFDRDEVRFDVRRELVLHLVFDYVITTHQFFPSEYSKPISKDRENLHQEIDKLHQLGWGYTKIHTQLRKNGFNIGKNSTTID